MAAFILIPVMTVVAYLLGSLSAAIIVSRYFGMDDPRSYGSGNPGASNMLRSGRKDAAALTLIGDALKGLIAVLLATCLQKMFDLGDGIVAMAALGVVAGHMWPLFFRFKGGKGVATALGVMMGMSLWTTAWVVGIWLVIAVKFKKSSLAALVAAAVAPFVSFIVQGHHPKLSWSLFAIALLVLYRHKDNVKRLREGNELGIGGTAMPLKDGQVQTAQDDGEVVDKVIEDELASIQEEINKAEELVQEVEQNVKEGVEAAVEKAKDAVETTKENVEAAVEKAKDAVQEEINKAEELVQEVEQNIKEGVEAAVEKAKDAVETTKENVEHAVENTVNKAKETAQHIKETAKEVAEEAKQNVKDSVETAKAEIDQAIQQQDEQAKEETKVVIETKKNSRKKKAEK